MLEISTTDINKTCIFHKKVNFQPRFTERISQQLRLVLLRKRLQWKQKHIQRIDPLFKIQRYSEKTVENFLYIKFLIQEYHLK